MFEGELKNRVEQQSGREFANRLVLLFASGSYLHGARTPNSDLDIAGVYVGVPKEELAIGDNPVLKKEAKVVLSTSGNQSKNSKEDTDISLYSLRRWAYLALKGNPAVISYLFAPDAIKDSYVAKPSVWDRHILPNRDMFLASGHAAAFLGLGDSQYKRMLGIGTGKHGQRDELIDEHGYDCYLDSETEFLTDHGWKRFDDVLESDKLATFDFIKGKTSGVQRFNSVQFDTPIRRIDRLHSGFVYIVEPQLTRCVVTPNHNMVVSPASRNPKLGFSTKYNPSKADWRLIKLSDLMDGVKDRVVRSMYHTPRSSPPRIYQYDVVDEYLSLAGLYLSEGSISFRDGKVKSVRVVQTPEGKEEYYQYADRLRTIFNGHRYDYPREHVEYETTWTFPRKVACELYKDFGHHKNKHLPDWCFQLGYEQAWILWNSLCLGDGSRTKVKRETGQGTILYTSIKQLADDVQAMMVSSGHICVVNGPYEYDRDADNLKKFGNVPMYQVYRPDDQNQFRCVNFKSGVLKAGEEPKQKYGYPVKEVKVDNHRVVCFEMPLGTLVTRSQGRPAFQGNCKAAMHMVRSMDECLELLATGFMTFPRPNVATLLEIRRGEWGMERIKDEYNRLRAAVQAAEKTSPLPPKCDRKAVTEVVVNAILDHWGRIGFIGME
jgi:hypothetical protein